MKLHLLNSVLGLAFNVASLGLVFYDTLTIGCQVHSNSITEKCPNFLDGKPFGLGNIEVGDDERDDAEAGIDEEHTPFAMVTLASGQIEDVKNILTCFATPLVQEWKR